MTISAIIVSLAYFAQMPPPPSTPRSAPRESAISPPPAPPAPPRQGTPGYDQDRSARVHRLREACISERGIGLIVESQDRSRAATWASQEGRAIDAELGQAAYAEPLDLDRLEAALARRAEYQAAQQARRDRDAVALLRFLPPADRAIYARQLTPMMVFPPPRTCPTPRR